MKVYFDERNVLVIDGEGAKVEYDRDKKIVNPDTLNEIRNFTFTPKLKPVDVVINNIQVTNQPSASSWTYPIRLSFLGGVQWGQAGNRIIWNTLSIESARKLRQVLADAITYAEATS